MRAVDPTPITLSDGKERHLLFTLGTIRRLRVGLGDMLNAPIEELVHAGLTDKDGLSVDQVADLIPLRADALAELTRAISIAITGKEPEEKQPAENPPMAQAIN